jgi:hypothetical protein
MTNKAAETETVTFQAPAYKVPEVQDRLKKLGRKAKKLGMAAPTVQISDPYILEVEVQDRKIKRLVVDITATRERIGVSGWSFVAAIDHMGEAGNVVRRLGHEDIDLVPYRTADNTCEHCGFIRSRKSTYVLVSDGGELKQVGSTCLADFLSGHNAAHVVALATYERAFRVAMEDFEGFGGGGLSNVIDLVELLTLTNAVVRNDGWTSRKAAHEDEDKVATADTALNLRHQLYTGNVPRRGGFSRDYIPTDKDQAKAVAAIEWALATTDHSEYIHNIRVIAKTGYATPKQTGFGASIYIAHKNAMAREAAIKLPKNGGGYVGTPGERQVFKGLKLVNVREWGGKYGVTYFHKFVDGAGNVLVWKGNKALLADEGDTVDVKATVKAHDTYKGTKQTFINRAVLA